MKKILLSVLLIIFSTQLIYAQHLDSVNKTSPQALHDFYIQKRNTNRTWGWVTLTSGVAMFVAGVAINVSQGWGEGNQNKGAGLSFVGIGTSLISIPLFIGAGKNNRKARRALKEGKISIGNGVDKSSGYLSFSFVIKPNKHFCR